MLARLIATMVLATSCVLGPSVAFADSPNRITVLYDAFGKPSELKKDFGFAALVEFGGKRILFDAGNDAKIFEHNVKSLGIDLKNIDCVVISHRHGDHTTGLRYLQTVNPGTLVYVPADEHFGGVTPPGMYRRGVESLPKHMRYFDGTMPKAVPHGTAWEGVNFKLVEESREIMPGVSLICTTSNAPGTMELKELSLSLRTPEGQILVVGCSHPGIEAILQKAAATERPVQLIVGGLHLVKTPEPEIESLATSLRDKWKIAKLAVGHCTSEPGFAALQKIFEERYIYAGLGTVLPLP